MIKYIITKGVNLESTNDGDLYILFVSIQLQK